MSGEDTKQLHPWRMPAPFCCTTEVLNEMHPLLVYNSLTRSKVRFIPKDGKTISWYQCGPTVYAESHLGHARTYVSLDYIRRILKDYLGYNIVLCQNITDIDDKIIIRSSERSMPFRELASKYEAEFVEDMTMLGVQLPDITTRVSEYVPEIIEYINDLVKKGIAYASNGSVYFSVTEFEKQGHKYGKLMPEQVGNSELLAEGEGALSAGDEKQSPSDFVLWKKTKEHQNDGIVEPSWESPWGPGRPGWHIECSVMSSFAMRKFAHNALDVHAGGIDLKFPHHENEIAQSEGYSGSHQWVNYWLHTGHLNIKGFKMSKSLKNFTTIRSALEVHTARQIRFCFLLHKYNAPMDYSEGSMTQAVSFEKAFVEFFHNVKALLRGKGPVSQSKQHIGVGEENMMAKLEEVKASVRESILDDFDTPKALTILLDLVHASNKYMESNDVSTIVLLAVARYITSMFKVFGLITNSELGFPLTDGSESAGVNKEEVITPVLDTLATFRQEIRKAAIAGDVKTVLRLADQLRDDVLPELGIRLEDKGSGSEVSSVWKLEDPEVLRKEKALKEAARLAKEQQKEEAARKLAEKEEKAKISPKVMFLSMTDLYSAFDETGMPTHDKEGQPLAKAAIKKLQKDYAKQQELHEKYLAKAAETSK